MSWALYELQRAPAAARRLDEELASLGPSPEPARFAKLPYLAAVCDETLRLHPLVPMTVRQLARPHTFAGEQYAAGTTFAPTMLLAHFNRDRYESTRCGMAAWRSLLASERSRTLSRSPTCETDHVQLLLSMRHRGTAHVPEHAEGLRAE